MARRSSSICATRLAANGNAARWSGLCPTRTSGCRICGRRRPQTPSCHAAPRHSRLRHRFIGVLIESYAGKFPMWLSPVQATVCTITNDAEGYAEEVCKPSLAFAQIDTRGEKINAKIRDHSLQDSSPVRGREKGSGGRTVAVRRLDGQAQAILGLDRSHRGTGQRNTPPVIGLKRGLYLKGGWTAPFSSL